MGVSPSALSAACAYCAASVTWESDVEWHTAEAAIERPCDVFGASLSLLSEVNCEVDFVQFTEASQEFV